MRQSVALSVLLGCLSAVAMLALGGCLLRPNDGQRFPSTNAPVTFSGYLLEPESEVRIYGSNTGTGRYELLGRSVSSSSPTRFQGEDWYVWTVTIEIGRSYWEPGFRGALARLRTEQGAAEGGFGLIAFGENPAECDPAHRPSLAGVTECAAPGSPALTICTADYEPEGSRRGECSRRLVRLSRRAPAHTLWLFPAEATVSRVSRGPIESLGLRADRISFVDVFRGSFGDASQEERLHTRGLGASEFIRLYDSRPRTSEQPLRFNLRVLGADFGSLRPDLTWDGGRSVRFYDRGECSVLVTWPYLLEVIEETLGSELAHLVPSIIRVWPDATAVLEPMLRTGDRGDAFFFSQRYYVDLQDAPSVNLRIIIRLTAAIRAVEGRLELDVEFLDLTASDRSAFVPLLEAFVGNIDHLLANYRELIARAAEEQFQTAIGSLSVGVIRRLYGRPEGYELVLAESPSDVNFGVLDGFCRALCRREDSGPRSFLGYFGPVFEPTPRNHFVRVEEREPELRFRRTGGMLSPEVVVGHEVVCQVP